MLPTSFQRISYDNYLLRYGKISLKLGFWPHIPEISIFKIFFDFAIFSKPIRFQQALNQYHMITISQDMVKCSPNQLLGPLYHGTVNARTHGAVNAGAQVNAEHMGPQMEQQWAVGLWSPYYVHMIQTKYVHPPTLTAK